MGWHYKQVTVDEAEELVLLGVHVGLIEDGEYYRSLTKRDVVTGHLRSIGFGPVFTPVVEVFHED